MSSNRRSCCCGCGDNPCNGREYRYENTSGSCPICAIGRTSATPYQQSGKSPSEYGILGDFGSDYVYNPQTGQYEYLNKLLFAPSNPNDEDELITGPHPDNLHTGSLCLDPRAYGAGVDADRTVTVFPNSPGPGPYDPYNRPGPNDPPLYWGTYDEFVPDQFGNPRFFYANYLSCPPGCNRYGLYEYEETGCDYNFCAEFYPGGGRGHNLLPEFGCVSGDVNDFDTCLWCFRSYGFLGSPAYWNYHDLYDTGTVGNYLPVASYYQFAPPWAYLPWSPQVMKDWQENWEGPLEVRGDCSMQCTPDNIGCHGLAFVGALGSYFGNDTSWRTLIDTLPYCGSDVVTIPPPRHVNQHGDDEGWLWIREWIKSGGKLVVMGESIGSLAGQGCRTKLNYDLHPATNQNKMTEFSNRRNANSCSEEEWRSKNVDIRLKTTDVAFNPDPDIFDSYCATTGGGNTRCYQCEQYEGPLINNSGIYYDCVEPLQDCFGRVYPFEEIEYKDMNYTQVETLIKEFAEFCAYDPDNPEDEYQFYDYCYGTDREKCEEPEYDEFGRIITPEVTFVNNIDFDENSNPKTCCQRTVRPFKKEGSHFDMQCSISGGLVPKNAGKKLAGSCEGSACTAIYKQNGEGAVIVIYDSNVFGASATQVPIGWYENAAQHPDNQGFTPEELKLRDCNNDFWKFLCEEFISTGGGECNETEPVFWDEYEKPYDTNQCMESQKAACCMQDGSCENLHAWDCYEKQGIWNGSYESNGASCWNGNAGTGLNEFDIIPPVHRPWLFSNGADLLDGGGYYYWDEREYILFSGGYYDCDEGQSPEPNSVVFSSPIYCNVSCEQLEEFNGFGCPGPRPKGCCCERTYDYVKMDSKSAGEMYDWECACLEKSETLSSWNSGQEQKSYYFVMPPSEDVLEFCPEGAYANPWLGEYEGNFNCDNICTTTPEPTTSPPGGPCENDFDCPSGYECVDGTCQEEDDDDGTTDPPTTTTTTTTDDPDDDDGTTEDPDDEPDDPDPPTPPPADECAFDADCPTDYCCNEGTCEECEVPDFCCSAVEIECLNQGGTPEECNCENCLAVPGCDMCNCQYSNGQYICIQS